jgi:hypothetical protein
MIEKLHVPVSVSFVFDSKLKKVYPKWIIWNNRLYSIEKIGFHHTYRRGRTLFHVFSVVTKTLFFKLIFDTETLFWKAEEISDGLPD